MTTEKVTILRGLLLKHRAVGGLFGTLKGTLISEQMEKPAEVTFSNEGYVVTLYIKKRVRLDTQIKRLLHFFPEFKVVEPSSDPI